VNGFVLLFSLSECWYLVTVPRLSRAKLVKKGRVKPWRKGRGAESFFEDTAEISLRVRHSLGGGNEGNLWGFHWSLNLVCFHIQDVNQCKR